jgi:hypothetical protein
VNSGRPSFVITAGNLSQKAALSFRQPNFLEPFMKMLVVSFVEPAWTFIEHSRARTVQKLVSHGRLVVRNGGR